MTKILFLFYIVTLLLPSGSAKALTTGDTVAQITVSPLALNFGNVAVGSPSQLSVVISNSSDTALVLNDSVGGLSAPFAVDSGFGAMVLDSGTSSKVLISFKPLLVGQFADTLIITSNADSAHQRIVVYVSGTGFIPDTAARISVTSTILDFGIVYSGQSKPMTLQIKNSTNKQIRLTGNVLNAHAPFYCTLGLGNFLLDSGRYKDIIVQCAPTDTGTFQDSIVINSNADGSGRRIIVHLRALVHSADELSPKLSLTTTSIDFGTMTLGSTSELQLGLTIKNVSDTERTLICNIIFPNAPFSTTGVEDHLELARLESQQLTVHFRPTAAGDFHDSIIIVSNSAKSRIPVYLHGIVIESGSVSNSDVLSPTSILVYPNPTSNMLFIRFHSVPGMTPRIVLDDVTGRPILTSLAQTTVDGENTIGLDVTGVAPGIYEGRIESTGTTKAFRVAIMH